MCLLHVHAIVRRRIFYLPNPTYPRQTLLCYQIYPAFLEPQPEIVLETHDIITNTFPPSSISALLQAVKLDEPRDKLPSVTTAAAAIVTNLPSEYSLKKTPGMVTFARDTRSQLTPWAQPCCCCCCCCCRYCRHSRHGAHIESSTYTTLYILATMVAAAVEERGKEFNLSRCYSSELFSFCFLLYFLLINCSRVRFPALWSIKSFKSRLSLGQLLLMVLMVLGRAQRLLVFVSAWNSLKSDGEKQLGRNVGAAGCCWVLLGVAGVCWVLLGTAGCCWVLLGLLGLLGDSRGWSNFNSDKHFRFP